MGEIHYEMRKVILDVLFVRSENFVEASVYRFTKKLPQRVIFAYSSISHNSNRIQFLSFKISFPYMPIISP